MAAIRAGLGRIKLGESVIQEFGDPREYIVRLPLAASTLGGAHQAGDRRPRPGAVARQVRDPPRGVRGAPGRARSAAAGASTRCCSAWSGILLYIACASTSRAGWPPIVAVFHDVIVCLGALSLTGREFSLPVLAALLTIIGYSVNDTIVAYDRLRENRGKFGRRKGKTFAEQMNDAVNQTLSRTVLTALTVFLSTAILLFFGGKS